jgi:hypothetical protein
MNTFSFLRDPGKDLCKCGHIRRSHNEDLPWARCGNTACRHQQCECEKFEMRPPGKPRVSH